MTDLNSSELENQMKDQKTSLLTEEITLSQVQLDRKHRSFFERTFSTIQPGALRGSIFALLACAMGTGMFNLPYRIGQIGVIPYTIFLLLAGLFSYIGAYLLSRVITKFGVKSYSEMADKAFGSKFKKFAQLCVIFYVWGTTICYQVLISKFILQLLADNFNFNFYQPDGGRQKELYTNQGQLACILATIICILLNLALILKKNIAILQKISIIGVLSVIFSLCVIVVTMFTGFTVPNCKDPQCSYHGITNLDWSNVQLFGQGGFTGFSDQIQGLASLIFCFMNHQLLFPLLNDLNNPTKKRMYKIFFRVHMTEIITYLLVGLSGYLLLLQHSNQRAINPIVLASIVTTPMSIVKTLMTISIFLSIPLNLFPARQVFFESFQIERNNKNHIIVSLSFAFSGTLIAILFQNVNGYFGILGGTAGVLNSGGFPALCYYKLKGLRTNNQKMLFVFTFIVITFSSLGAILSVAYPST